MCQLVEDELLITNFFLYFAAKPVMILVELCDHFSFPYYLLHYELELLQFKMFSFIFSDRVFLI